MLKFVAVAFVGFLLGACADGNHAGLHLVGHGEVYTTAPSPATSFSDAGSCRADNPISSLTGTGPWECVSTSGRPYRAWVETLARDVPSQGLVAGQYVVRMWHDAPNPGAFDRTYWGGAISVPNAQGTLKGPPPGIVQAVTAQGNPGFGWGQWEIPVAADPLGR